MLSKKETEIFNKLHKKATEKHGAITFLFPKSLYQKINNKVFMLFWYNDKFDSTHIEKEEIN